MNKTYFLYIFTEIYTKPIPNKTYPKISKTITRTTNNVTSTFTVLTGSSSFEFYNCRLYIGETDDKSLYLLIFSPIGSTSDSWSFTYEHVLSFFYVKPTTIYTANCPTGNDYTYWLANDANDSTKQYFFAGFESISSTTKKTSVQAALLPFVFQ